VGEPYRCGKCGGTKFKVYTDWSLGHIRVECFGGCGNAAIDPSVAKCLELLAEKR